MEKEEIEKRMRHDIKQMERLSRYPGEYSVQKMETIQGHARKVAEDAGRLATLLRSKNGVAKPC